MGLITKQVLERQRKIYKRKRTHYMYTNIKIFKESLNNSFDKFVYIENHEKLIIDTDGLISYLTELTGYKFIINEAIFQDNDISHYNSYTFRILSDQEIDYDSLIIKMNELEDDFYTTIDYIDVKQNTEEMEIRFASDYTAYDNNDNRIQTNKMD